MNEPTTPNDLPSAPAAAELRAQMYQTLSRHQAASKSEPLNDAVRLAVRRVAEFLVFTSVCVFLFENGPFWGWPPFLRVLMGFGSASMLFLLYVAVLQLRSRSLTSSALGNFGSPGSHLASSRSEPARTFKVPRNFGMQTMVAAMLAFAVLTATMQNLGVPLAPSIVCIVFVCFVSAMQIFMNTIPRVASALAGFLLAIGLAIFYFEPFANLVYSEIRIQLSELVFLPVCGVFGAMIGYLGGALIAGILLFADSVAEWWNLSVSGKTTR